MRTVALKPDADASGVLVTKNSPDLVAAVDKAIDGMKAGGTYAALSDKQFGTDVSK